MARPPGRKRILVVGGGYIGTYAALKMQDALSADGHELVLVNPENFMMYQPFLPEVASGNIEPRHVLVPLRQILRKTRVIVGEVERVDHDRRVATIRIRGEEARELPYDIVVLGAGSRSRVLPIPGLAEHGIGFKTVPEAIFLRNQLLSRLDAAFGTADPERRRAALTFVFVGAGYAGVEALAELEDLARAAVRYYPGMSRTDMRWVLVELADHILPELGPDMARYVRRELEERDIEVLLNTSLEAAEGGLIRLSDGQSFPADTLVWTAGVRAEPLGRRSGLPTDGAGRILVDEYLRVKDVVGAWAAGDNAAVPDLVTGGLAPATAQHAVRQGKRLGENLVASLQGRPLRPFRWRNLGQLASLGRYKGAAKVLGFRIRGFPAWWLHRSYHLLYMPTINRKARIVADWTVGLLFPRDVVQLGSLATPREPFRRAAER
ncbi:MAG: NAD(P)/FAD-dependent oxidoreductase [Candidatus Velamenicoccus archaeovorus]